MQPVLTLILKFIAIPIMWLGNLIGLAGALIIVIGLVLAFIKPLAAAAVVCGAGFAMAIAGGLISGAAEAFIDRYEVDD
jgi:hypothetical protein